MPLTSSLRIALATLVVAILVSVFGSSANAQVPPARALFLDLETVFVQSAVGKNIRSQLEAMLTEVSGREAKEIEALDARQDALMRNAEGRNEQQMRSDWEIIQAERAGKASFYQLERTTIQQAAADARRKVNAVLNEIMQEILLERGANMILSTGSVLVGGVDYDVTAEVISRLDGRMSSLKVERPR
ncbi:OmpH family outer membrane protein [Pyruvatibacter sp.]|uniref:OmpH family outer membrane protein n=1 Tax=Pyruvatibacter sp. TaxID=1981328 RepID=UPI0032EB1AA1